MFNRFRRAPDYHTAAEALARHGVSVELHRRFAGFLAAAPDRELFHLNPRALAARLATTEREALRLLVAAVYEGLVNLHWEVRCPMCGNVGVTPTGLPQLHAEEQCHVCHARFAPRLDDEVRVRFSLHPRLRALPPAADDAAFREATDALHGPVSGHDLLALPLFRRLFPLERLPPDESLLVTRAALLFTDLAGSTALYARRGDPRAFHLVRLHFDALFAAADDAGGSAVKTIGDAVMAVFLNPADALAAALAMQRAVQALNARAGIAGDDRLILKVGLHCGPCLSVTLNERPDYFGTTVNIAARVQGLSQGGDVVLTDAVRDDPQVAALLAGYALESDSAALKGVDEPVRVHRVAVIACHL
jgi:class 3 adenylate cyclase